MELFVFTENHSFGGGTRYLVDLVNGLSGSFANVIIGCNHGALNEVDFKRLNPTIGFITIFFLTTAKVEGNAARSNPPLRTILLLFAALIQPLMAVINVILFLRVLNKLKPSVVLCCNGGYPGAISTSQMALAARILGLKVALSVVSIPVPRRRYIAPLEKLIDRLVSSAARVVIVNCRAVKDALHTDRDFPIHKLEIVYNGLDECISGFSLEKNARNLTIGLVSRMEAQKGLFYLLDAFEALCARHSDVQLILVGNGNALPEIKQKIASYRLEGRVTLLGHFDGNINELLQTFDIFVFPSLWEGFPYSILEAMRSGCAIVSTNVGGIPEALTNGVDALLVPPGNAPALYSAVDLLLSDSELRNRLSSMAREKFAEKFILKFMHGSIRATFTNAGLCEPFTTAGKS